MKRAVILQSNYIPWRGYFDLIHDADLFVFHDDLQYTKDDWRNRNRIMTEKGPIWITIPAGRDEKRLICEVEVADVSWKKLHRRQIEEHYRKAPFYDSHVDLLDFLYDNDITNLSNYNQRAIRHISSMFNITTEFMDTRSLEISGRKTQRLIQILTKVGATHYLSGPSARNYIDELMFKEAGIVLEWKEYPVYPTYPQQFLPFSHAVSIIDLILNVGPDAPAYIWGERSSN